MEQESPGTEMPKKCSASTTNELDGEVSVLLGAGDGSFGAEARFPAGLMPQATAAGDVDGDGDADLVVADELDGTVSLLIGAGDGTFTLSTALVVGDAPFDVGLEQRRDLLAPHGDIRPHQYDAWWTTGGASERKVPVARHQNAPFIDRELPQHGIGLAAVRGLRHVEHVVPLPRETLGDGRGQVLVNEEAQSSARP